MKKTVCRTCGYVGGGCPCKEVARRVRFHKKLTALVSAKDRKALLALL